MKKTAVFRGVFLACIFQAITAVPACADPLAITPGLSAITLVNNLMGTGVTYSNAVYTGDAGANGTFTGGTGVIGFESGIILSSGLATSAAGPNLSPNTSKIFGTSGDMALNALGSTTTFDAAVLEFDFVPTADTLSFSFVFGSEEYNEFVNSFNDIFAIFLDGANVAIIPGTSTPISIDNINNCVNPAYYINNNSFPSGSSSCSPTAVANANLNTQFDGITVVITLNLPITPGISHHLKIAIADVLDGAYDSAVFIKSASFNSGTPTVTPTITPTFTWTDTDTMTYTGTITPTFTHTFTITPTFTWTLTQTPSFTPTFTPTITNTFTVTCTVTPTVTMTATPPFCMDLKGAFPNPFTYNTHIVYSLCRESAMKLTVYTVSGEVVRVFEEEGFAGYNTIYWDGKNRAVKPVSCGVFIYSLEAVSAGDKKKLWGKCAAVK